MFSILLTDIIIQTICCVILESMIDPMKCNSIYLKFKITKDRNATEVS